MAQNKGQEVGQGQQPKTGTPYSQAVGSGVSYDEVGGQQFSPDTKFRKVSDDHASVNVQSEGPGRSQTTGDKMTLEWLGELDFTEKAALDKDVAKQGEKFVVLSDYVSGADGLGFMKGQVRSASELFNGFGDPDRKEEARNNAVRLINLKAVRLADSEEAKQDFVDVDALKETPAFSEERSRRMALERENEELRAKMEEMLRGAQIGQKNATPAGVDIKKEQTLEGTGAVGQAEQPKFQ